MWGEWSGSATEGCSTICRDLGLESGHWQLGKTKIFIRFPETLFHLEEQVERKDYECAANIQKAWKKWQLAKHALEQKKLIADLLRGKKERRRESISRQFSADYMAYEFNFQLQELIKQHSKQESVIFADQVLKLNRRNRPERRDFVMTDQAFYIAARAAKDGNTFYKLTRRTSLADISHVSLSTLQDNYMVFHIPNEYDALIENDKKTEILAVLYEAMKNLTRRELQLQFTDNISYKIRGGDTRILQFMKNEGARTATLAKAGKTLKISICSGEDKNLDVSPQLMSASAAPRAAPGGARGRGGAAPGGRGAPVKSAARPAPAPVAAEEMPTPVQMPLPTGGRGVGGAAPGRGVAPGGAAPGRAGPVKVAAAPGGAAPGRGVAPGGAAPGRGVPTQAAAPGGGRGTAPGGAPGRGTPVKAAAPPPPKPSVPTATALYAYTAQTPDELSFAEGAKIIIVQKDPGGWWEGELNGKRGWVPANYLKE